MLIKEWGRMVNISCFTFFRWFEGKDTATVSPPSFFQIVWKGFANWTPLKKTRSVSRKTCSSKLYWGLKKNSRIALWANLINNLKKIPLKVKRKRINKFFAISSRSEKTITPFTMTRSAKTSDKNEWISLKFVKRLFDFYNLSSPANQFSEAATGGVLWKKCSLKFLKIHRKTPVPQSLF